MVTLRKYGLTERRHTMNKDLTKGPVVKSMLLFAIPMILGDLLQQCYNIADTLIVGQLLGKTALAAVGSSFTLMTFITSIILGLCMGSGALFSIRFGQRDKQVLKQDLFASFFFIAIISILLNIIAYICLNALRIFLRVPHEVWGDMRCYLLYIFMGIIAIFLYNFFSAYLRSIGNSVIPLIFLAISSILNIILDLYFVLVLKMGVGGAALATVLSQYVSGIGIMFYTLLKYKEVLVIFKVSYLKRERIKKIISFSLLTCIQQSVMNLGILMVQGLVNSFGTVVMAAFAAAVKIDAFAYMPVQDFGNAFSTFVAQNYGAGNQERIRKGTRVAFAMSIGFSVMISVLVCLFAGPLMKIFVSGKEVAVIAAGVKYLRIEGAFYLGIGCLFLLYGYYRAIKRAEMSVVLTVISLGLRVLLAYVLSAVIGEVGIWVAIPIGWVMADVTGIVYMRRTW